MKKNIFRAAMLLSLTACVQEFKKDDPLDAALIDQLSIPAGFDYATTKDFDIEVTALDNGDKPLKDVVLEYGFRTDGMAVILGKTVTDSNGISRLTNSLPDYVDSLFIRTEYLGLPGETRLLLSPGKDALTLGGKTNPVSGPAIGGRAANVSARTQALTLSYLSTYDASGVPNNLEPVNDYIPQDLLDLVNNSLPERYPVPTNNPGYIAANIISDTRLGENADVWVTFVHEGAGYTNTLGFYTYNLNSPPTTINEISNLKIIFPNVSLPGSGGNLRPGNKVHLGRFPANTGIGWFLIPNGWNGAAAVEKPEIKYSTKALNTYTQADYRQQIVLLKDNTRELLLLGIEDLSRPGGDNDFNDAVFFVTANPYSALINDSNLGTAKTATGTDTDKDGVIDRNDKYPTDAEKAFDVYNPGENIYGSLAFEDQWPGKGDYDLNDLVVDYNFQFVTNTSNAAVECRATFQVKAIGAAYHNGFGIELPVPWSMVASVTGSNIRNTSIVKNANGTEADQQNATIILFTDAQSLFNTSNFVNTRDADAYQEPVAVSMVIKFTAPIKMADLGYAPFNPFIFTNGHREVEVHLPDAIPTSKADKGLLGTSADSSVPLQGRYYKSGNNLPWAINLPLIFDYPRENRPVNETHLKFGTWSQTGGISFKDWYKNLGGYRDDTKVYKKK